MHQCEFTVGAALVFHFLYQTQNLNFNGKPNKPNLLSEHSDPAPLLFLALQQQHLFIEDKHAKQ